MPRDYTARRSGKPAELQADRGRERRRPAGRGRLARATGRR